MTMVEAWVLVIMDYGGGIGGNNGASVGVVITVAVVVMVVAVFTVRMAVTTGSGSWLRGL